jgi:predicted CXXCH cytochrome family protein
MSFVIRQIAKRADGGDIIRTRTLPGPEISVGRGTDCDIQLPDLGVMLRHARLSLLANGLVAVEATGGVPLEIGGRFLNRADLDIADTPAIDIASHRLILSRGETAGDVAITAERVVAISDAADAGAETGIFSLRETLPGKRGLAWGLAIVILLAFLALPVWLMAGREAALPRDMVTAAARPDSKAARLVPALGRGAPVARGGWSPDMAWTSGPLSTAHAGLANNCGACHQGAFVAVRDAACTACHTADATPAHAPAARLARGRPIAAGMAAGVAADVHRGLNLPEGRCAACHKEHEGPRGALMVAQSFCTDCHTGLSRRLTDTGLVDVADWERHPQFKPTLVKAASPTAPRFERVSLAPRFEGAPLAPAPREQSGLVYPHKLHLSATNSVGNMVQKQRLASKDGALACSYCHVADSDGVRFKPIEMEANCSACHDLSFARDGGVVRTLPHGKPEQVAGIVRDFYVSQALAPRPGVVRLAFERRPPGRLGELAPAQLQPLGADAAIAAIFAPRGVCADCHGVVDSGAGAMARRFAIAPVTLNDHYLPKARFPHNRHQTYAQKTGDAACVACHRDVPASKLASDVLLPPVATCRECHGATRVATNVPATCDTCHGFHGPGVAGRPAVPVSVPVRAPVRVVAALGG